MLPLQRLEHDWGGSIPAGLLRAGTGYRVMLTAADGRSLERRDPYAHAADYDSAWYSYSVSWGLIFLVP